MNFDTGVISASSLSMGAWAEGGAAEAHRQQRGEGHRMIVRCHHGLLLSGSIQPRARSTARRQPA